MRICATVALYRLPAGLGPLHVGVELSNRIKLMLAVQSCLQIYFGFLETQITSASIAVPPSQEGRIAIVTDVGCGMRWT
jgi:hypothetical protein